MENARSRSVNIFFRGSAQVVLSMFKEIRSTGFDNMVYINLGGGLGIPYRKHVSILPSKKHHEPSHVLVAYHGGPDLIFMGFKLT